MKGFMIHICKLLVFCFLAVYVLDFTYTEIFRTIHARNKVQLTSNTKNVDINYIFLGSSRVENHIDCDQIEEITGKSCINLGLIGGKPNDINAMMALIEMNKITYEKIFVQIDYSYNDTSHSPLFKAQIAPFVHDRTLSNNLKPELLTELKSGIPFYRYAINDKIIGFREVLLKLIEKDNKLNLKNGFVPLLGNGTAISGHFPDIVNYPNKAIEKLIDRDSNVVLFTAPYCNSSATRNIFMKQLKSHYPQLHDYSQLFDQKSGLTINCGHLNNYGAKMFTDILTQDLILN